MRLVVPFVVLALAAGASIAPAAGAAGRPTCLVSNQRTGVGTRSLQAAVDTASPGDTLIVKGTCIGGTTIPRSLTIRGLSNPAFGPATLDGGGAQRVLFVDYFEAGRAGHSLTLDRLTIKHGLANDGNGGGGILMQGGTVTVQDSVVGANSSELGGGGIEVGGGALTLVRTMVRDNVAGDRGGGISAAGSVTLMDSVVRGNTASFVGGGLAMNGGTITIEGSSVTGNRGAAGGGIYNAGALTMTGSTVSANTSTGEGGGIWDAWTASATITDSAIDGNTATSAGGGISNRGTLTVTDSSVDGNVTANVGGGIYNYIGTATLGSMSVSGNSALSGGGIGSDGSTYLTAVTVTRNSASVNGGGIIVAANLLNAPSSMTISGSTITSNTAANGGGINVFGTLTFEGAATTVGGNAATGAGGGVLYTISYDPDTGSVTGGCPTSLGGNVVYAPSNTPTDYEGFGCGMPVPQLATRGTEDYTGSDGHPYTRYDLTITNWASFSADLFQPAPDLPPCGLNTSASRTWVLIHDGVTASAVYGFCALSTPEDLTRIWFAMPLGTPPPASVYVTITDRRTGSVVTSNSVSFAP